MEETEERRGTYTAFLIESAWILPSIAIPVGMIVALLLTTFLINVHLPGQSGHVNPQQLNQTPPFDHPGLRAAGPGQYDLVMIAQTWQWTPNQVRVPAGSTVNFVVASRDVTHGLLIDNTDVNLMVLPGHISRATYRFNRPGDYPLVCHEYCGIGHQTMAGHITVEGR